MAKKSDHKIEDRPIAANIEGSAYGRFRLLAVLAFLLVTIILAAVYFYQNQDQGPVNLTVGAGPYRSDSYELMREVADVVSRHSDEIVVNVVATGDSSRNISMLNLGEVDLATIRSDTPVINKVRMIADLFPDYFQIITRRDANIRSVNELANKRIAIPPYGTDEFRSFWILGDHYDLPIEKMDWRVKDFQSSSDALLNGEVDAIFTVRSVRDRLLLGLFEDAELKRVSLDFLEVKQAEAIALKRPFLQVGEVPQGAFSGNSPTPSRDTTTPSAERILVTRNDVDPDAVRELTRVLFEHRLDLVIRFALASAIRQPDFERGLGVPLHDGAQQYFDRNEPSFIQENAEPLALVVTLLTILISGLFALRSRLVSTQKNRMDSYNYVLLDMAEKAEVATSSVEIKEIKAQMFALLETVVKALDTDEVTEEGFQSFSLLWEAVREILNERNKEILSAPTLQPKRLKRRKNKSAKRRKA